MRTSTAALILAAFGTIGTASRAVVVGQIDTFSSATVEDWFAGGGPFGQAPPVAPSVALGGPAGAADPFLQVTGLGGVGPGSRLVAMNAAQWAGNYLAAGIGSIEMDVRNFGPGEVQLRLFFEDPIPGPPQNAAFSSVPVTLAPGGDWTHVVFPIGLDDLTTLLGSSAAALSNTTVLRLFHGSGSVFPGAPVTVQLGVDNIFAIGATQVAEPSAAGLALAALGLLVRGRRGRR